MPVPAALAPRRARPVVAAVLVLLFGCGAPSDAPERPSEAPRADPAQEAAGPPDPSGVDGRARLVPGASQFTLRPDGVAERASIPFVYRNEGPDTLYHPTCRDESGRPGHAIGLQRPVDGEWTDVWFPVLNECLSDPVIILPGERHSGTVEIWLHPQDSVHAVHLTPASDLSGPFRLVWLHLLRTYDPEAYPFGEEIPLTERVSGSFTLRRP